MESYLATGAIPQDAEIISSLHFGARYVTFRDFERFTDQIEDLGLGTLQWPGGTLSEKNIERFGFEYEGLYNSEDTGGKPGIDELMAYTRAHDMNLAVSLPTARYKDDHDLLREHLSGFLDDLYTGHYGELPNTIIFDVGNEYYGVFDGSEAEAGVAYMQVANVYAEVIAQKEQEYPEASQSVIWAFQAGRDIEAIDAMLAEMSDDAIEMTDLLVHHRFTGAINGADKTVDDVAYALDEFADLQEDLGIDKDVDVSLSAYNTASLSRNEALTKFLEDPEGEDFTKDDVDMDGRTTVEFEEYYQELLHARDHGLEAGHNILQMFSEFHGLGMGYAATYGWDLTHNARHSYTGEDGQDYVFTSGHTQSMMAESLQGTKVLDWYQNNDLDHDDDVRVWGFDSDDKLVIFLGAPDELEGDGEYEIPLEGLNEVTHVWGERLDQSVPENWMEIFGVQDLDGIDQSAEAETYAVGERIAFQPEVDLEAGVIRFRFTNPDQIVRLSFARSQDGAEDIRSWQDGSGADIDYESIDFASEDTVEDVTEDSYNYWSKLYEKSNDDVEEDEILSDLNANEREQDSSDKEASTEQDVGSDESGDAANLAGAVAGGFGLLVFLMLL